jgi:predicted permease
MASTLAQQIRMALRGLAREPGVAFVAIASLAIGIAANATIFSLVQSVEFPNLIYPQASRVVFLESRQEARGLVGLSVSAPDALDLAQSSHTLELISLTADQSSIVRETGVSRRVGGRRVTPTFFDVLGVPASRGRTLNPTDDQTSVVLSDGLWHSAFRGDASIVGRALHLDSGVVTVVGVMPARFDADADFWIPLPAGLGSFPRDDRQFTVFARLAANASLDDATRELADISRRLAGASPATNQDWVMFPTPITQLHGRDSRSAFIQLQAAVGILLLVACANIANILLARGTRRRHEMALCVSLGASRGRLLGQLLTESLVLSSAGGALGIVLAMWGIRLAKAIGGFPDVLDPSLNPVVVGVTVVVSMLTGIVCGILPAVQASTVAPEVVLRAEGGRGSSGSRGRLRAGLVALQIGSAVVLTTCGALVVQSLLHRERVDLGFDPRGVVQASVELPRDRYRDTVSIGRAVDAMLERIAQTTDVTAASAASWALPTSPGIERPLTLPAARNAALSSSVRRAIEAVTPRYFDAIGATMIRGRAFTADDRAGAAPVAIVNDELATRLWGNQNPIGEPLRLGAPEDAAAPVVTVVGIVSSTRRSVMHDFVIARAYVPLAQHANTDLTLMVRARGSVGPVLRGLPVAVGQVDPGLLVENAGTVEDDLAQFVAPTRQMALLLTVFATTGLLLAALGVFGAMSYSVSQREREMAVRSALGAGRGDLVRLVLRRGLMITIAGLIPGAVGALLAARTLQRFLFGVDPADPLTLMLVVCGLALVSLAACYRPAQHAATVDPMTILRP